MAYDIQAAIATVKGFQDRVAIAMLRQAITVSAEASSVTNHGNRVSFARSVMQEPLRYVGAVALAVVADNTTGIASTDTQLDTRVTAVWDALSGVV